MNIKEWSLPLKAYVGLVVFSVCGTLLSKVSGLNPGPIAPVAAILTLMAGLFAVFEGAAADWGLKKTLLVAGLAGLVGAASEIVGLHTGLVFGKYEYTSAWWPTVPLFSGKLFPLLLPFAWLMVAGGAALAIHEKFPEGPLWLKALGAGLLAAIIDLPMEPVMVNNFGYWKWLELGPLPGGAPIMNFVGWFATSLVAAGIILGAKPTESTERVSARAVLIIHVVFVILISFIGPTAS